MPLSVHTLSKQSNQWAANAPQFAQGGRGSKILVEGDHDWWLDCVMGLGAVILGYERVERMTPLFSLPSTIEIEVAELLCEMGGHDKVRLGKTGSDAVAAAVRCARIATGKNPVLVDDGYHGWHDWFASTTERNKGIGSQATVVFGRPRGGLDQRGWLAHEKWPHLACVVLEPDRHPPEDLVLFREECDEQDVYLIFDEVITGFRYPDPWPVKPDLTCYGKTLANGMAVSAVCGSDEAMRPFEHGFWSTTHAHERVSMAAALATLRALEDGKVAAHINDRGQWLMAALRSMDYRLHGYGARIVLDFDSDEHKTAVLEVLADRRILCNGNIFLSAAHTDADCERILDGFARARDARVPRGRVISPVYRQA